MRDSTVLESIAFPKNYPYIDYSSFTYIHPCVTGRVMAQVSLGLHPLVPYWILWVLQICAPNTTFP